MPKDTSTDWDEGGFEPTTYESTRSTYPLSCATVTCMIPLDHILLWVTTGQQQQMFRIGQTQKVYKRIHSSPVWALISEGSQPDSVFPEHFASLESSAHQSAAAGNTQGGREALTSANFCCHRLRQSAGGDLRLHLGRGRRTCDANTCLHISA